ncbi:MAG: hypothetical protein MJ235_00020 [archaeon]|nr:hypothetical protein [archaeon]
MKIIDSSINAKVPNIPILGFDKTENGYIFKSNLGNLRFKDEDEIHIINDIEVKIKDVISISFSIDWIGYHNYFYEEIGENKFTDLNELKYYEIDCISGEYKLYFSDCYWVKIEDSCKIYLQALQVNIKNEDKIDDEEIVNVWNILESSEIEQSLVKEFDCDSLKKIFIKSEYTNDYSIIDENNNKLLINEALENNQFESFNQLLDGKSFLFTETTYQNVFSEEIENIERLLMFYDSTISPVRMRIIESKLRNRLEVIIIPKSNAPNLGNSIFRKVPNNFFNFINSSYQNYLELKNSDLNIDLLFHYFTWIKNEHSLEVQLVLCSAFMEILKNNQFNRSRNENLKLFERLQLRIEYAGLDPIKIFKYLQPPIYEVVSDIKKEFKNEEFYSDNKFHSTWEMFLKTYISSIITFYRNKLLHSGQLKMEQEDIKEFINKWESNFKKGLGEDQQECVDKISEALKDKLIIYSRVYNIIDQCSFIKEFIDLILLALLDVDCTLTNELRFETKLSVKKVETDDVSFNSQDYLKKFISK